MKTVCRNLAPKTKNKGKDTVANERFKKNMWKIKWLKIVWFYTHNWKPSYSYSCSFRDLGDFWTEIARRTCDKEALDGALDSCFWVFVISELRELVKSWTIFQDSISPQQDCVFSFPKVYRHTLAYKNALWMTLWSESSVRRVRFLCFFL